MNNKWNQFKQHMMTQEKPDTEKLINLATLLRKNYHIIVKREPILLFTKDECRFVKMADSINKEEYHTHIIHVPDLIFYINNDMWIMEIDGYIHNYKNKVIENDKMRNEHYTLSGINHIVINELYTLHNLGIHEDRSATVEEIWEEIQHRMKKIQLI